MALNTQSNWPLAQQGPMRDVFSQAPYYQGMQMPTNPAPINASFDGAPGSGLRAPQPVNNEPISRDDEGHMTVTTLIDVKRSDTSAHLEDSQYAFLHRSLLKSEHQEQLKATAKPTEQRFGKMTVLTLPLANHLVRRMSSGGGYNQPNFSFLYNKIKTALLQQGRPVGYVPTAAEIDALQLPESMVDDMLLASVQQADGEIKQSAASIGLTPAERMHMTYGTAQGVLNAIAPLGGICTQPNKLRTTTNEGPGNFTAEGGDTSAVIGWRGNVDQRDVWNLTYTRENPINHSRHLFFVLKRTYLKAPTLAGVDILTTKQDEWSALQYVPVAGDFTKDYVPSIHTIYLGYGGAVEWGKVIYVGLAMQQVDKRIFSQTVHDAGAGIATYYTQQALPGTPNQLSMSNMMNAARSLNLFITLADPSLGGYYVPVHA